MLTKVSRHLPEGTCPSFHSQRARIVPEIASPAQFSGKSPVFRLSRNPNARGTVAGRQRHEKQDCRNAERTGAIKKRSQRRPSAPHARTQTPNVLGVDPCEKTPAEIAGARSRGNRQTRLPRYGRE